MPPFVPRKRDRSASPQPDVKTPPAKRVARTPKSNKKKPSLFDDVDAKTTSSRLVEDNKKFLAQLDVTDEDDDELSDISSDDFEDVMPTSAAKRRKVDDSDDDNDEDEEMTWEDAITDTNISFMMQPTISGNLELTLDSVPTHTMASVADTGGKKGPSKIERGIRINTHCMHVQSLLLHNMIRNGWTCNKGIQKILLMTLSPGLNREIDKWKSACGNMVVDKYDDTALGNRGDVKGKGKKMNGKPVKKNKNQRDWGKNADVVEVDTPNTNRGDPTLRLLKYMSAFWKKRFSITAPGMRKQGYKELARLEEEVKAHRKEPQNQEIFGERIKNRAAFRKLAEKCTGSRDVGAQLFTALLRGIGMEARLVASLQPIGFGWSKMEDAHPSKKYLVTKIPGGNVDISDSEQDSEEVEAPEKRTTKSDRKPTSSKVKIKSKPNPSNEFLGNKSAPIDLSDSESELSSPPSSDESLIDVTPAIPTKISKRFDRDLPFPIYWTEVLSPMTQTWIPVDPIVLSTVVQDSEKLVLFEPRGAKADKAKQVHAYVVAFSADGTAKDVTVRYLKRHMWPGKTKGVRIPAEKMPIYNKRGKIIGYEKYDWFSKVMRLYARPFFQKTEADRIEDANELLPVRIVREPKAGGEETLQGYKNSAEFVLERHLRREEALLPNSKQVKTFTTGKGDKLKSEPVYRRKDVVPCRTIESWHKEGRAVREGEQPMKHVPMRAVTLIRKREIEEAERESGEKMKQALYSRAQTDWIIPPPIQNGVIPKNTFGNMDVYVPTMVPCGAVHVRLKGTARICKKLGIDFAEACTGFEFGNKRAVPILTGVVVCRENESVVRDAWKVEQAEKKKKENAKREKIALGMWKKMIAGLRIVERVRKEYGGDMNGHIPDAVHPMAAKRGKGKVPVKANGQVPKVKNTPNSGNHPENPHHIDSDSDIGFMEGGFMPDETDVPEGQTSPNHNGNGDHDSQGGGFVLEDNSFSTFHNLSKPNKHKVVTEIKPTSYPRTPVSLQSLHHQSLGTTPEISGAASKSASVTEEQDIKGSSSENDNIHDDDDDEEEDEDGEQSRRSPVPAPPKRVPSTRGRGRGRGGISKPPSTSRAPRKAGPKSKAMITPSDDDDENDSDNPAGNDASIDIPVATAAPQRAGTRTRKAQGVGRGGSARGKTDAAVATRRNAGRKSKEGVRSKYFDVGSGEDGVSEDVDDVEDAT